MSNVKLFENQKIRSIWIEAEQKWYFSVADVVGGLTDSADAKAYWRQLKRREPQLVTDCHGFKLEAADGKQRLEDCAHTEGLLRIIQSVPSPKAEPFKRWLAKVGYERLKWLCTRNSQSENSRPASRGRQKAQSECCSSSKCSRTTKLRARVSDHRMPIASCLIDKTLSGRTAVKVRMTQVVG